MGTKKVKKKLASNETKRFNRDATDDTRRMRRKSAAKGLLPRDMALPGHSDVVQNCEVAAANLADVHEEIISYLQAVLRASPLPKSPELEQGQLIAQRVNDLLTSFGARFRLPGTNFAATLGYHRVGTWVLQAHAEGARPKRSLGQSGLSEVELIPLPPESRSGRTSRS